MVDIELNTNGKDTDELVTERLLLKRTYADQHAEEINASICDIVDFLQPWIPWIKGKLSVEDTRIGLQRFAGSNQQHTYRLYLRSNMKLVGMCGLMPTLPTDDEKLKVFEVGFWLHEDYVRKGLMSEALNKVMSFGVDVLQAQRFILECTEHNIASNNIAKKFGFNLVRKECTMLPQRPDWGDHILMHYQMVVPTTCHATNM